MVECQVLSTEPAKQFQTLSGLEVMHHTVALATAYKTINVGWMAQNAAYSILPDGQNHDKKYEESLQQLCTKADKAWKDTNDLVFNHQLCYDGELLAFIFSAERTLQEKWDKVWGHIRKLTDVAGVPHDTCLSLALQVLNKLPTILIDLSYCTLIPLMLAYGLESYTYQTWCKEGGETCTLSRDARGSHILMWKLEWLAHGEGVDDSSSNRSALPAHSTCSAAPHFPRCSSSQSHSRSKSPSLWCWQSASQLSLTTSIYSQETQKESVQTSSSESGSKADTEFQADGDSDGKAGEGSGSEGEGSGSKGEGSGG